MRKTSLMLIAFAIFFISITGVSYAIAPDQQAKVFIDQAFQDQGWFNICEEDWESIGFANLDQAKRASVGEEPLQVYKLDIETVDCEQNLAQQAQITPLYVFPVVSDDKVVTDIYVNLINGNWEVLKLGGHLYESVLDAASKNDLEMQDCKIVQVALRKMIIANKNGNEIGVSYPNSDSLMTKNNMKKYKETILNEKHLLDNSDISNEQMLVGNEGNNDLKGDFQQNTNIWKRLVSYIAYKFHW